MIKIIRIGKKYNNHIVSYKGLKFDSKLELACYKSIKKFTESKKLNLELQKTYKINNINRKYIADFVVTCTKTGKFLVIDAKGVETSIFKIKKELLKLQNIHINCVNNQIKTIALLKKTFA